MAKRLMKGGNAALALIPFVIIFIVILMIVLWQSGVFSPKQTGPSLPPIPAKPSGPVSG